LKTTARKMLLFEIRRKEFRVVLCAKKPVMLFADACAIRRNETRRTMQQQVPGFLLERVRA
jgi:hypothetical protein